jgi:hypothetical protein
LAHLNIALARAGSQICLSSFYEGKRPYLMIRNGARGSAVVEVSSELGAVLADCHARDQVAPGSEHLIDCGPHGRVVLSAADRRSFVPVARLVMTELLSDGR